MEKVFTELLEAAKTDRKLLISLKIAAVKNNQFEIAANLRALELELFPYSTDVETAKNIGIKTHDALELIGLSVPVDFAWVLYHAVKTIIEKEKGFNSNDAAALNRMHAELFNNPK